MTLDKAIEHGKERRKPYRGAKSVDSTCRNHGSCPHCEGGRKHKAARQAPYRPYTDLDDATYTTTSDDAPNDATRRTHTLEHALESRVGCRSCQWAGIARDLVPDVDDEYCPSCGAWDWVELIDSPRAMAHGDKEDGL